jgi:hypothetical protein
MCKLLGSEKELFGKPFVLIGMINGESKEDVDKYAKKELSRLKKNPKTIRSEIVKEALRSEKWEPRLLFCHREKTKLNYNLYLVKVSK